MTAAYQDTRAASAGWPDAEALQGVCEAMGPCARRLVAVVAGRDPGGVRHVLREACRQEVPAGADPLVVLAVVLAELAAPARQAVRVVLGHAQAPAQARELLDMLGLAETAHGMRTGPASGRAVAARRPSPGEVVEAAAGYFGVPAEQLLGRSRAPRLALARQVAMYLCRELAGLSLPEVGRAVGGRDHATALHAVRKVHGLVQAGGPVAEQVADLSRRLAGAAAATGPPQPVHAAGEGSGG